VAEKHGSSQGAKQNKVQDTSLEIELDVEASYEAVRQIDSAIVELLVRAGGVDEETLYGVELAVHEICTNIVEHAYGERPGGRIAAYAIVEKSGFRSKRRLLVDLRDSGDVYAPPPTTDEIDLDTPHEGGYGLYLSRALMDEVRYERQALGNRWQLSKRV
jgi:serine/threonine-protein kinase RsbW